MTENKKVQDYFILTNAGYLPLNVVKSEKDAREVCSMVRRSNEPDFIHTVEHAAYQKAVDALKEFALGESQWLDGVECMHKAREVLKELGEV